MKRSNGSILFLILGRTVSNKSEVKQLKRCCNRQLTIYPIFIGHFSTLGVQRTEDQFCGKFLCIRPIFFFWLLVEICFATLRPFALELQNE